MFFESIKLQDGQLYNLELHLARMQNTCLKILKVTPNFTWERLNIEAKKYPKGLFKARLTYLHDIENITITPYEISSHYALKLIEVQDHEYAYKSTDRTYFEDQLKKYDDCDDLLFTKNGFLTDTTFCNILLLKDNIWFTPTTYLLPGTKRASLIRSGKVKEAKISVEELATFQQICFINALRDFEKIYTFVIKNKKLLLTQI